MTIEPWMWWAAGGALVVLEALTPGIFMLWLGIAALLTGAAAYLAPTLAWQAQLGLFAAFALAALGVWLALARRGRRLPGLTNRRGEQCIGRTVEIVEPVRNGRGRARLGDGTWSVTGPDLDRGATAVVVRADGALLVVQPTVAVAPRGTV